MRGFIAVMAAAGLAACSPAVPDSNPDRGAGVGFGSYSEYQQRQIERERALQGQSLPSAAPVTAQTLDPQAPLAGSGPTVTPAQTAIAQSNAPRSAVPAPTQTVASAPAGSDEAAEIAASTRAALNNSGSDPLQASPSNPAPALVNNPGISDENDFAAVASRRSIEGDAARLQQRQQQYTVVQPTALPSRAGNGQPNVVQYALRTSHAKGTRVHRRVSIASPARTQRNCAAYSSADEAQIDFLASGGPQRDRKGLDPDGDGFACAWDPAPFRRAAGN